MQREYDPVIGEEIEKRPKRKKISTNNNLDYSLLFVWLFIMLLGFVVLYSASSYISTVEEGRSTVYLEKQIFAAVLGLIPMFLLYHWDYRGWKNLDKLIYGISIITIFLVRMPVIGIKANGAYRWVKVGPLQFQPAELVKLSVILLMAYTISKCTANTLKDCKNCWKIFMITFVPSVFIVLVTSNLSSAIIIMAIGAIMLLIAGACWQFFVSLVGVGGIGIGLILLLGQLTGKGFRSERILVMFNPEKYADDGGYQVLQGLYAVGSGGLFGKGLGNSSQKLGFLPESQNDMIFAIVCEELGVFGAICIIFLFVFMIRRMRVIASNAKDLYGSMIVIGVLVHISIQVALNIAVVTNSVPNTGVSLPFMSYGGTSLMFLMIELGLVFSVSRRIKQFD